MEIELVLPDNWSKEKDESFRKAFSKKLSEEVIEKSETKKDKDGDNNSNA